MRFVHSRRASRRDQHIPRGSPHYALAIAVIVLCGFVILATLLTPGADILDQLVPLVGGLLVLIVRYYFERHRRK